MREISPHEIDTISGAIAVPTNLAAGGRLCILAGGRRAPNPAEILSGPAFGQLVAEAMRIFNRIVIDSAPILAVSDTLLMTPHVQTVCMVLRAAKTPRPAVRRAIALLINSGIRPAGLVLNRLPRSLRFPLEPTEGLGVVGEIIGQELQGNMSTQLEVFRFIHHTHTTAADLAEDAVMGNHLPHGF